MNEIAKSVLSIIGLVALFVGFEYGFYQISDRFNKHSFSYIIHGFILFCFALETLYPG